MTDIIENLSKVPGKDLIVIMVVFIIGIYLFEYGIQPVLVNINPTFADQYGSGVDYGRRPTTPAGIALWATCGVLIILYYMVLLPVAVSYLSEEA